MLSSNTEEILPTNHCFSECLINSNSQFDITVAIKLPNNGFFWVTTVSHLVPINHSGSHTSHVLMLHCSLLVTDSESYNTSCSYQITQTFQQSMTNYLAIFLINSIVAAHGIQCDVVTLLKSPHQ